MTQAARLRVLMVSFAPGVAGPQRWLDQLLAQADMAVAFDVRVWCVEDRYRGLAGKWRLWARCRQWLREFKPQRIYISHDLNVAALVAACFRLMSRVPILVHSHAARFYRHADAIKPRVYRWMVRRCCDRPIAVSDVAARAMFGDPPPPFAQIPAAIDFEQLWRESQFAAPAAPIAPATFSFACIGRLSPEKNQAVLIRALASLPATTPSARLLLLGEGEQRAALTQLAAELGVADRVLLLGNVAAVGSWYAHAIDALLAPSHYEGQGRTVAEAQLFGVPVWASLAVPALAFLQPDRARRVAGDAPLDWAKAMLAALNERASKAPLDVAQAVQHPWLGIAASVRAVSAVLR